MSSFLHLTACVIPKNVVPKNSLKCDLPKISENVLCFIHFVSVTDCEMSPSSFYFHLSWCQQAAEEQKLKEEQARKEHEEYLKMKEMFSVDEEGIDAQEQQDVSWNVSLSSVILLQRDI